VKPTTTNTGWVPFNMRLTLGTGGMIVAGDFAPTLTIVTIWLRHDNLSFMISAAYNMVRRLFLPTFAARVLFVLKWHTAAVGCLLPAVSGIQRAHSTAAHEHAFATKFSGQPI
jgi:hypothetical protein